MRNACIGRSWPSKNAAVGGWPDGDSGGHVQRSDDVGSAVAVRAAVRGGDAGVAGNAAAVRAVLRAAFVAAAGIGARAVGPPLRERAPTGPLSPFFGFDAETLGPLPGRPFFLFAIRRAQPAPDTALP